MSNGVSSKPLDAAQRERLAALADALMPAGEGLPAPSEVDVQGRWIDDALASVPMMAPAVHAALEIQGEVETVIEQLRSEQPAVFIAFSFIVSGAYFMHPRVRHALGYEGPAIQPQPALEGEADYFLEGDLLGPVLARGPIFRRVPDGR